MHFKLKDITKLPNILTLVRIGLIPVFVVAILIEDGFIRDMTMYDEGTNGYIFAALIVILSGITDAADGFIARRFNMITDLGKVLDPLADKLTQAAVVVCLVIRYRKIWWLIAALFMLLFIKEVTMLIMGLVFLKKELDLGGARWYGKVATILFYAIVIILLGAPRMSLTAAAVMILVLFAATLASFILYMREYYLLWKRKDIKS